MVPNYTMLKIDGSLRTAVEACDELKERMTSESLTTKQILVILAIRLARFAFRHCFKLPPERD